MLSITCRLQHTADATTISRPSNTTILTKPPALITIQHLHIPSVNKLLDLYLTSNLTPAILSLVCADEVTKRKISQHFV